MGAICGTGSKFAVQLKDQREEVDRSEDYQILKMRIQEKMQVQTFDMFIDGKLITSQEELKPFLETKVELEITIKEKQLEKVLPPVKPVAAPAKIEVRAHAKVQDALHTVVDKTETPMFSTMLLLKQYLVIHKRYVPKNPSALFFKYKDNVKEKMIPTLEFSDFWLYKIEMEEYPSLSEDHCVRLTRKAKILGNKPIDLAQNYNKHEHYKASEYLNENYLGFPVFSKYNLVGYVKTVTDDNIILEPINHIIKTVIPSTIKVRSSNRGEKRKGPTIPESVMKMLRPGSPLKAIDIKPAPKNDYEMKFAEKPKPLEAALTLDTATSVPENYSYLYLPSGSIATYHNRQLSPVVTKIILDINRGATFTTTPEGLFVVYKTRCWKIGEHKIELNQLGFSHRFHSAVWHKNTMYVISGKDCTKTEFLDHEMLWQKDADMIVAKENAAVCSSGESIYLAGGREAEIFTDTVYKYTSQWEELSWKIPWKLEGMGMLWSSNQLIMFGGFGKVLKNGMFITYDATGKEIIRGELPKYAFFSDKSFGCHDNSHYSLIAKDIVLEYSNCFKLVFLA